MHADHDVHPHRCSDDEEAAGDSDAEAAGGSDGSQDGAAGADSPQHSDDDKEEEEEVAAGAAAAAHEDPGSDSSDEERPQRNTIGEVPLEWYKDEEHVGYDVAGNKLEKKARRDRLDQLIARNDSLGKVGGCLGRAS
jgi:ribosome biogenesis protein ERB1